MANIRVPEEEDFIVLKGGHKTRDIRLGRVPQFDKRSLNYNAAKVYGERKPPRTYSFRCLQWLDQGENSSCVGHSFAHELIAKPKEVQGVTNQTALDLYHSAQKLDEWEGQDYEGTSIIGGAKATVALGKMASYHWATTVEDMAFIVSWRKPIVLGINWYDKMFNVDSEGFARVGGRIAGGHAILVRGFDVEKNAFHLRNSWGIGWGWSGDCYISFADMQRLLSEQGEALVPDLMTL